MIKANLHNLRRLLNQNSLRRCPRSFPTLVPQARYLADTVSSYNACMIVNLVAHPVVIEVAAHFQCHLETDSKSKESRNSQSFFNFGEANRRYQSQTRPKPGLQTLPILSTSLMNLRLVIIPPLPLALFAAAIGV